MIRNRLDRRWSRSVADAVDLLNVFSPFYENQPGRNTVLQGSADDTVGEKTWAVYGQLAWAGDIAGRRANALIGVRYEQTRVNSIALQSVPQAIRWAADNDFTSMVGLPAVP